MAKLSDTFLALLQNTLRPVGDVIQAVGSATPAGRDAQLNYYQKQAQLALDKQAQGRSDLSTLADINQNYDVGSFPQGAAGPQLAGTIRPPSNALSQFGFDQNTILTPKQQSVLIREPNTKTGEYTNTNIPLSPGQTFKDVPRDPFSVPQGAKTHQQEFNQKELEKLGEALDPSKQRQGAFGVSKQVFDRAERLESLASAFKDNNLQPRQMEELAIGLNAMLSGSNTGAQEQVKALVPNTIVGNAQKLKEWLINKPLGTNQQAFVQTMLGSISREKQTAADQIKRTQYQRISRFNHLATAMPSEFSDTLRSYGIEPDEYSKWKSGGFKPMTAVQSPDNAPPQLGAGLNNQSSGMVRFTASDGTVHDIPAINLNLAKQRDPGLQVMQ